jgi:putative ABC transport system permease protein
MNDLKFSLRTLRKNPGFTAVAFVTLALGIGAATLIFSAADALLFHAFPYRDADRLVLFRIQVHELRGTGYSGAASPLGAAVRDFRRTSHAFEDIAGFWNARLLYTSSDGAQPVEGAWVTDNAFPFLGVPAEFGRGILPGDQAVCVVSHRFWTEQLHSDPKSVGAVLDLNGTPRTVVGVMPPRFQYLNASIWIPLTSAAGTPKYLEMIARLKPGIDIRSATAEFDAFEHNMVKEYPKEFPNTNFTVSLRTLLDDSVGNLKPVLFTLFGAVFMLLLIACCNVANLLLVRGTVRQREMAIRAAVGASRGRLVRQLLVECGVLAAAAGAAGCGLAAAGLRALTALIPARFIPAEAVIGIHPPALLFALGVTVATTLLCGLVPALKAAGSNLAPQITRTSHRGRSALVALEVALSIVLLVGAGLMVRTFIALTSVQLGFNPSHLLSVELAMPGRRYMEGPVAQTFLNDVVARVRRLPGVAEAGVSLEIPPAERGPLVPLTILGRPQPEAAPAMLAAGSDTHFQAMGRAIRRGRTFTEADLAAGRQVLVVNETFARAYFGKADPTSRKVRFTLERMLGAPEDPTFEIVGVVSDVRNQGVRKPVVPEAYIPYTVPMVGFGRSALLVRTIGSPAGLAENIRRQVWMVDSKVMVTRSQTLEQAVTDSSYAEPRFGLVSMGGFAAIGLALVIVGVFSVMAYTVSTQIRDIGVRMALGAQQADILGMVLRRGLQWVVIGAACGVPASLLLTRLIASQLWGVSATDPWTFAAVVAVLLVAGAAASFLPARHAAKLDPLVALRHE